MEWFCVEDFMPEDCKLCHFYKESNMEFTTVLVMGKNGNMEIRNRIKVEKCGIPFADEYATDGWEWSNGGVKPEYHDVFNDEHLLCCRGPALYRCTR